MARKKFTPRMEKLFDLLRRIESENLKLTERDFADLAKREANYKEIKTYRSKFLDGALVFPCAEDPVLLRVRGALAMSTERFAQLLSQKKARTASLEYETEDEWRETMRKLAALGLSRHFVMARSDKELFSELFETQRALFPRPTVGH